MDPSELEPLIANLRHASRAVAKEATKVVRKSAQGVSRSARRRAPVDTGNLRSSIGIEYEHGGLTAHIAPSANYAVFVEYGTSRMAPQPFMGPALEANRGGFAEAMAQLGAELI